MADVQPASAYTPQGQAVQGLQQAMAQIQQAAPQAQSDPSAGISNAFTGAVNAQQPANFQQAQSTLFNQSGIPSLIGQQNNLGQVFGMYLADQQLAQKYADPSLNNSNSPTYNNPNMPGALISGTNTRDPYLNTSAQAIVNAIMGNPNSSGQYTFQGFNTPTQNTAMATTVPNSAESVMGDLTQGINAENSAVQTDVNNYETNYGNIMNSINNLLTNTSENAWTQAGPQSAGSTEIGATTYQSLKNSYITSLPAGTTPTPDGLYDYIRANEATMKAENPQLNLSEIYKLQGIDRNNIGGNGDLNQLSGKAPKKTTGAFGASFTLNKVPYKWDSSKNMYLDTSTGKYYTSDQLSTLAGSGNNPFGNIWNDVTNPIGAINQLLPSQSSSAQGGAWQ